MGQPDRGGRQRVPLPCWRPTDAPDAQWQTHKKSLTSHLAASAFDAEANANAHVDAHAQFRVGIPPN